MAPVPGIAENLRNKSILVTGCTGFLAKIFVEKILRVQPEVKRMYLLIRAADAKCAKQRLDRQVMNKELFRLLRSKHGDTFDAFISDKICPVAGDVAAEGLGIAETHLREEMLQEVEIIAHVAATTTFDERYDVALNVNALGALRVLDFAHQCEKLEMFLHVSTAYVCGSRSGVMLEKPIHMGETPLGIRVDVEEEVQLAYQELGKLRDKGVGEKAQTACMKEFGLKRSRHFGWPNSYSFTKAIGEMLIGEHRKEMPVVIIRPTVVEATLADPFPGWIEGFRTSGSIFLSYGKGRLKCFPGNGHLTMDVIPADMVVNAMVVSMAVHSLQPGQFIYHVGSSSRNPVKISTFIDCAFRYFSSKPLVGKDGKLIRVGEATRLFGTMAEFRNYMSVRYNLPLLGLKLANLALFNMCGKLCNDLTRRYKFVMYTAKLYEPYSFFDGSFDDQNSVRLTKAVRSTTSTPEQSAVFNFDVKCINWEEYCMNIYLPGLVKHVVK